MVTASPLPRTARMTASFSGFSRIFTFALATAVDAALAAAREAASAADDIATEARKTTPGAAGGGADEAR